MLEYDMSDMLCSHNSGEIDIMMVKENSSQSLPFPLGARRIIIVVIPRRPLLRLELGIFEVRLVEMAALVVLNGLASVICVLQAVHVLAEAQLVLLVLRRGL